MQDHKARLLKETDALPERDGIGLKEIRYDATQNGWWDIGIGLFVSNPRSVDSMVNRKEWPVEEKENEKGEKTLVKVKPSVYTVYVDNGYTVDSSTWWPGQPQFVNGQIVTETGEIIKDARRKIFNMYRPPPTFKKPPKGARNLWKEHVEALWPDPKEHNYFFDYCAHMLQRPEEKPNAFIVLSGAPAAGKDMTIDAIEQCVGLNNTRRITPDIFAADFNPWLKCLLLNINEFRSSKEDHKAMAMYGKLKTYTAAPPHTLTVNEKYMKGQVIMNVVRVFITTNDLQDLFISDDDRRAFIMHTDKKTGWQPPEYFRALAEWYDAEGIAIVSHFLKTRDLSSFNPKAKPVETIGREQVTAGWRPPDDDPISLALDRLGAPDAFFSSELANPNFVDNEEIMKMLQSPRRLLHRMRRSGYLLLALSPPLEFPNPRGGKTRYKTGIFKEALVKQRDSILQMLEERGRLLSAGNVTILPINNSREGGF